MVINGFSPELFAGRSIKAMIQIMALHPGRYIKMLLKIRSCFIRSWPVLGTSIVHFFIAILI